MCLESLALQLNSFDALPGSMSGIFIIGFKLVVVGASAVVEVVISLVVVEVTFDDVEVVGFAEVVVLTVVFEPTVEVKLAVIVVILVEVEVVFIVVVVVVLLVVVVFMVAAVVVVVVVVVLVVVVVVVVVEVVIVDVVIVVVGNSQIPNTLQK